MLALWIKAFHLIFVIAWMAGLLIYPRLKIYQLNGESGSQLFEEMKLASKRLKTIILTPALVGTWLFGLALIALNPGFLSETWFHIKLALVGLITVFHMIFIRMGRRIDRQDGLISSHSLRILNEIPFVAMMAIVILVIVKPF